MPLLMRTRYLRLPTVGMIVVENKLDFSNKSQLLVSFIKNVNNINYAYYTCKKHTNLIDDDCFDSKKIQETASNNII